MSVIKAIRSVKNRAHTERGQTLVEYVMLISLFSITMFASLSFLSGGVNHMMDNIVAVVDGLV